MNKLVTFGHSCTDDAEGVGNGGFTRYSNGKIWAEYVSDALGIPLDNKAWGGAKTDYSNTNDMVPYRQSGFLWQVDKYLPGDIDRTLHNVWIGFNDFWDAAGNDTKSVENIIVGLNKLVAKGAKYISVFKEIRFDAAPGYRVDFQNASLCHDYTYACWKDSLHNELLNFNAILTKRFQAWATEIRKGGVQTFLFDTYSVHGKLFNKFKNTENAWTDFQYVDSFDSSEYMW